MALITKELIKRVDVFEGMTEMVRSKISNRSLKLFTLSGIYHATETLLSQKPKAPFAEKLALATQFWTEVANQIPDWSRAKRREISPAELRAWYVHSHAIALAALARAGRSLLEIDRDEMAKASGTAPETQLAPIEPAALGGSSHDRRPPVQVEYECVAHGQRHQAAVEAAADA